MLTVTYLTPKGTVYAAVTIPECALQRLSELTAYYSFENGEPVKAVIGEPKEETP